MLIHIVKSGETYSQIAAQYNVPLLNLLADNGLTFDSRAVVGQALVISETDLTHVVEAGETLSSIAARYGVSLKTLYRNNYFLGGAPDISPGQTLNINLSGNKIRSVQTNGYAYPFISLELLREQLPFMTYQTPFTYGISANGDLVDLDGDTPMIDLADELSVKSLMHLSTLTEYGTFSSDRATLIFDSEALRTALTDQIIENIQNKGYGGLDVDFEFIDPAQKNEYVEFLEYMRGQINTLGYPLFSALAPKTSDDQRGTLYEGHDYAAIGAAVDKVLLMTYEWGYTYSEPMAVAPIGSVERVIQYAVTRIPPSKIFMGIPTYGYDWPLPYVKGMTKAMSLSPVRALQIAERYGAVINYDETAQTPWFEYQDEDGVRHEVWFEDARSITVKYDLADRYNLFGFGYWSLDRKFPQNLVILNSKYEIAQ